MGRDDDSADFSSKPETGRGTVIREADHHVSINSAQPLTAQGKPQQNGKPATGSGNGDRMPKPPRR